MGTHRLKHSFTAGELTPLLKCRPDFDKFADGCKRLSNFMCTTQGPVERRPGFEFIMSLNDIPSFGDAYTPKVRMIPFIFSETQAYSIVFYTMLSSTRAMFCMGDGVILANGTIGRPTSEAYSAPYVVILPAGFDIDTFDFAQANDELYITQSGLAPLVLKRFAHNNWTISTITFTSPPAVWSDVNGWPSKVTLHQQRLVFSSTTKYPHTTWLSRAGDLFNFGVNSPLLDSDSISFTLASGTQNKIVWTVSGKALYIGTIGNEWTVQGNTQTALTPSNVLAQKQTNKGSDFIKPLSIGATTLFVERKGRTINEFNYEYSYDSYDTSDLTVLAPHMTEQHSITAWAYQQTPDSVIWALRDDGVLLGITYQRQHKVVGWHTHDTQGQFKTVCSTPGSTREDDVWVVVYRNIDGNGKYFIEKLADRFTSDVLADARFLDSFVEYKGVPVSSLSGLPHLMNVPGLYAILDGAVQPVTVSFDVPTGKSKVNLGGSYSNVALGLTYTSEVRPLVTDVASPTGTAMGKMQRVTNIDVMFHKTLGGYIGREDDEQHEEHLEEILYRTPDMLPGDPTPLFSGLKHIEFPEGFDREPTYFIRQTQPLPMTVLGVVDTIEVYE